MSGAPTPLVHRWPVRIYFEDTDAAGIVYHGRYLNFCERARTEFLRALGLDHPRLLAEHQSIFVVRRVRLDLRRPAHLDDRLTVVSSVHRARGASVDFEQRVERADELIATAMIDLAVVNPELRPRRLPPALTTLLAGCTLS